MPGEVALAHAARNVEGECEAHGQEVCVRLLRSAGGRAARAARAADTRRAADIRRAALDDCRRRAARAAEDPGRAAAPLAAGARAAPANPLAFWGITAATGRAEAEAGSKKEKGAKRAGVRMEGHLSIVSEGGPTSSRPGATGGRFPPQTAVSADLG